MRAGPRERLGRVVRRARGAGGWGLADLRDWLETTENVLHLSVLVAIPVLIALVTLLANATVLLPFLLFPPLASGSYTLFAHPESEYASPRRFVGGLTTGAVCGYFAIEVTARYWYHVSPQSFVALPGAAAFSVFLTGVVTWALDVEEPAAYSSALLVLVTGSNQPIYVVSVALSTAIIAGAFVVWRRHFYEQRARYLYRSTRGDDHVLVPTRGPRAETTAMLGGRLAAAHEGGTVFLLDLVEERAVAAVEDELLAEGPTDATEQSDAAEQSDATEQSDAAEQSDDATGDDPRVEAVGVGDGSEVDAGPPSVRERAEALVGDAAVADLEDRADRIESALGVPCEVIVALEGPDPARTVLEVARENGVDLVVAPYERRPDAPDRPDGERVDDREGARLSAFTRGVLGGDVDVVVHRSVGERTEWNRVLVAVGRAGDVAHATIDFAVRLAHPGRVSVCHCIDAEGQRRAAEDMLADLVGTVGEGVETRVAREPVGDFLRRTAPAYDLVIVGASTDRSVASRIVAPPTFRRLVDVDCDVAIVHRA